MSMKRKKKVKRQSEAEELAPNIEHMSEVAGRDDVCTRSVQGYPLADYNGIISCC